MAEAVLAARKILILIAKAHADATADTAKCPAVADGRFSAGGTGCQPHDAAPFVFFKLQGILGLMFRPDQGNGAGYGCIGQSWL